MQIKEFELEISPMVQNEAMPLNMCAEHFLKADTIAGIMYHSSTSSRKKTLQIWTGF